MVLSLSAWGAVRMLGALRWWSVLYEFEASLSPTYLFLMGAGWLLAGGILLWGILYRRAWAHWAIPLSLSLWLLQYWLERLFFHSARANLSFAVIASILLLLLTGTIALSPITRHYFRRSEEHEQPDKDPVPT
jgi:hypothetical protein